MKGEVSYCLDDCKLCDVAAVQESEDVSEARAHNDTQ